VFVPHAVEASKTDPPGPLVKRALRLSKSMRAFVSDFLALRVQVTPTRAIKFKHGFYSTEDRLEIAVLRSLCSPKVTGPRTMERPIVRELKAEVRNAVIEVEK